MIIKHRLEQSIEDGDARRRAAAACEIIRPRLRRLRVTPTPAINSPPFYRTLLCSQCYQTGPFSPHNAEHNEKGKL